MIISSCLPKPLTLSLRHLLYRGYHLLPAQRQGMCSAAILSLALFIKMDFTKHIAKHEY
ncbi:hypothetical protein RGR602_PC01103 (plasmid) [Rhizobium gallicum bv. gallicum R602sp]|uniref:Uncharacterized protein n=1 Tax=Rhizobium gallicum bv. gallicum R602sp TaxID=1041138 RepID=A0A0B4XAX1_9HYPH|nr:hypothetical protein RGR602_PC01103 [Rhizobium gallicum bv. gallicum R602sp]TDW27165.1 hypothetical protein EV128_112166 [Rhizobium azibense]